MRRMVESGSSLYYRSVAHDYALCRLMGTFLFVASGFADTLDGQVRGSLVFSSVEFESKQEYH